MSEQQSDSKDNLSQIIKDGEFRRILENTTDGVVTLNKSGKYTYANPAAEKILGISSEKITQRSFDHEEWSFFTINDMPLLKNDIPFQRVLHEGNAIFGMKLIIEQPTGERVITSTNAAPLFDSVGNFDGVVGVITDITEQQETQERNLSLHQILAHDLRGPLTVMQGHAEMLKSAIQQGDLKCNAALNVEEILGGVEKINIMIGDILDTSHIESCGVSSEKEPIELETFVWSLIENTEISTNKNRLTTQIPKRLPCILANPRQLERIFLNLIGNALKFSPKDSKVAIKARQIGSEICISVIDQGKGIASEDCSRIFKRFYQVKSSESSKGVGLGLYICRLLIEGHGGHIWVESKSGEGSTFHFTLPTQTRDIL